MKDRNQIATIQNYWIENVQKLGRKCIEIRQKMYRKYF